MSHWSGQVIDHSTLLRGINIRVVQIDGEPWFVAADVCAALGLSKHQTYGNHFKGLEDSEKRQYAVPTIENVRMICFWFRAQTLIAESGLYRLVMRSDKPQAKPFRFWVVKDVLPSIRKTGGYIAGQEKVATGELSDREFLARAMQVVEACQRLAEISGSRLGMKAAIGAGERRLAGIRSD